ncbi:ATP-binding protein [Candidatus Amarolinea aalborgensis]|uniref:ATP-binding protein n=1 Tax=Candidatus Amarolinea aalborgensis TaxID=2249329 RepID=UPI003BF97BE0
MSEIRFALSSGDRFNSVTFDRLLTGITQRAPEPQREIVIDLSGVRFMDPYGMVCLVMLARSLQRQDHPVAFVLSRDSDAWQFGHSMGFHDQLALYSTLRNTGRTRSAAHRDAYGLGLTPIQASTDVALVVGRFLELARAELGFSVGDLIDSAKIVSELSSNVKDHSRDLGLAAAHLYRDRQGRRYVSIGVADMGIGIRQSLSQRHAEAGHWTHAQAVAQALEGLSSRATGGGLGLSSVRQLVRRYQGRLSLRSGDAKLQLSADKQPQALHVAFFAGAQVGISFSQVTETG